MKNKGLECLGWLIIVVVAFWGGRLTAPEKVRIEKQIRLPEHIVYKIDEIPLNAIEAYLGAQGLEVLTKAEADKIKADEHLIWQSGYKTGYIAGYKR